MRHARALRLGLLSLMFVAGPVLAVDTVLYNNDFPDGKIVAASGGAALNETADDFFLTKPTQITNGSFTGLIPKGASISSVGIAIYGVVTSEVSPRNVPTRVNSPTDDELPGTVRETGSGLTFFGSLLSNGVGVANSVVTGINPVPLNMTGGDGGASGEEIRFNFNIDPGNALTLDPGHYFFRPLVETSSGNFLWLSAGRPIHDFGSTPINPDLQAWTRNGALAPDWLRIGTDIIGPNQDPATYNMAFRLVGTVVPEPTGIVMMIAGLIAVGAWSQRKRT